tara:strand:- start:7531 stop:8175 length:645 start_codon:yes stop_codon:yes gene_type:complete
MLKIKEIRTKKNLTQNEIVGRLDVSKRTYVAYENGESDIPFSKLQNIATILEVSISELIDEKRTDIIEETPLQYDLTQKGVPYYDLDFTASFLEVENNQQSQPDSYISHPFFKNCDLVVRASGQSMAKLIKHGDAIGLTRVQNWTEFIPMGEIYAIVTKNNFRMIKIITKGESEGNYTLISKPTDSKKEEFPAQQIKKTKILHVYKVQASATLY